MVAKNKPYEQFGTYVLFKKLETDPLGELWRAARIQGDQFGPLVALRKLTGGDRAALAAAALTAREVAPLLTGTSFAKHQEIDVANGVPFVTHEYGGGRSLRHIIDRARGGQGGTPHPLPLDLAIVIAEKIALSLETLSNMRFGGNRLQQGALIPQFVWIAEDGEIRVAGQMLGPGFVASLKDAKLSAEIGRYFAPEHQATGELQKTSTVYSIGAILYLLITGLEPPDPMTSSAWTQSVRAAKNMSGGPIPDDIRAILDKSFVLDPAVRFASITEMKQALSALAHSGKYSGTTFNVAFYVSTLLKKEMEGEAVDRERESKVSASLYQDVAPEVAPAAEIRAPDFGVDANRTQRSKAPMMIAAAVVLAAIGTGAYFMTSGKAKATASRPVVRATPPPPVAKPLIVSEPIVASGGNATTTSTAPPATTTAALDAAAQKKAFEQAVNQKLQAEMMKLQDDYTRQLQQKQSKNAPAPASLSQQPVLSSSNSVPRPTAASRQSAPVEEPSLSAAQLDQARRDGARPEPAVAIPPSTSSAAAPAPTQPPAPVTPTVREGDVVLLADLDTVPHVTRPIRPGYPPMAARQRAEANILITVLVSESGDVIEARVLRGDTRFGFEDAAVRAARSTKFSPALKDGKRVRTWFPLPFIFKQ